MEKNVNSNFMNISVFEIRINYSKKKNDQMYSELKDYETIFALKV